jgi:hypothetical protein
VLIIGNEILSGRTRDVNPAYLATADELGIRLREAAWSTDVEADIVKAVNECRARYDYVSPPVASARLTTISPPSVARPSACRSSVIRGRGPARAPLPAGHAE